MSFSKVLLRSTIASALILSGVAAEAGLDLTATANEYVAEGMKHVQLNFRYDKAHAEYEPPPTWTFAGSSNQLRLTPPKKFAEAIITVAPTNKPAAFDESGIALIREQFIAALPPGSQFAKIEEEIPNAVLVGGNAGLELTASYKLIGEKLTRSTLFVNLKDAQMQFQLTAKKDDFRTLHRDFKASILSWQWVHASDQPTTESKSASASTQ